MTETFYSTYKLRSVNENKYQEIQDAINSGITPYLQIIDLFELDQSKILQKMGVNNLPNFTIAQMNGFSVEQIMKFCEETRVHPADLSSKQRLNIDSNIVRSLLYISRSDRYNSVDSEKAKNSLGLASLELDMVEASLTYKDGKRKTISHIKQVVLRNILQYKDTYPEKDLPYSFKEWCLVIKDKNKRITKQFNKHNLRMFRIADHLFDNNSMEAKRVIDRLYSKANSIALKKTDHLDGVKYVDKNVADWIKGEDYDDEYKGKVFSYSGLKKEFVECVYECNQAQRAKMLLEKSSKYLGNVPELLNDNHASDVNMAVILDNFYTITIAYNATNEQLNSWISNIDIELSLACVEPNQANAMESIGWSPPAA